jgi:hypothetical protein
MKRIIFATALLFFGGAAAALAQPGQTERNLTVDPVVLNSGQTWRLVKSTPPATTPVLVSSAAETAVVESSGAPSLEINVWGERYLVNYCTAAAVALSPTQINFTFNSRWGVVLSSAGSPSTNPVGGSNNSIKITWQGPIWAAWDSNAAACAGTGNGMGGYETYNHPSNKR